MCQTLPSLNRTAGVICLAFWAFSCGDRSPSAPTQISPASTPVAASVTSLNGLVTDESDNPIAAATVTANLPGARVPVMTDTHGRYEMTVVLPNYPYFVMVAEKVGHELNQQVAKTRTQNFRLYRIARFVAGESRRVTITADDSLCAGDGDYYWRCRTFRVQTREIGTLVLEVVPDDPAETGELQIGPAPYNHCCSSRASFSTPAAAEVHVTVLAPFNLPRGPQTFTLNTSLQAQ